MSRPHQFSLAYLFLELFWIALTLGCATQAFRLPESLDNDYVQAGLLAITGLFLGTAIGGLFGRMTFGFFVAFWTIVAGLVLLTVI